MSDHPAVRFVERASEMLAERYNAGDEDWWWRVSQDVWDALDVRELDSGNWVIQVDWSMYVADGPGPRLLGHAIMSDTTLPPRSLLVQFAHGSTRAT